jgi:hypothetical protein
MTRQSLFVVSSLLAALCAAATPGLAQVTRDDISAVVTFRNAAGDAVRGDTSGAYVDGQRNVRAIMTGFKEGNLVLDTNDGRKDGGRRVLLAFGGQEGMSDGAADVFMPMRSENLDLEDDLRTLGLGQFVRKRLNINWVAGKVEYHLRWNGESGNGLVTVQCTAAAPLNTVGDTCGAWTFTATASDLAGLYTSAAKGSYKETYVRPIAMPHEGYITLK